MSTLQQRYREAHNLPSQEPKSKPRANRTANSESKKPALRRRLWRWTKAQLKRLLLARLQRMPQSAIDARLKVCEACPHLQLGGTQVAWCGKCGCGCRRKDSPVTNKLAVATEKCPDDPPRWGVYEPGLRRWGLQVMKWFGD